MRLPSLSLVPRTQALRRATRKRRTEVISRRSRSETTMSGMIEEIPRVSPRNRSAREVVSRLALRRWLFRAPEPARLLVCWVAMNAVSPVLLTHRHSAGLGAIGCHGGEVDDAGAYVHLVREVYTSMWVCDYGQS